MHVPPKNQKTGAVLLAAFSKGKINYSHIFSKFKKNKGSLVRSTENRLPSVFSIHRIPFSYFLSSNCMLASEATPSRIGRLVIDYCREGSRKAQTPEGDFQAVGSCHIVEGRRIQSYRADNRVWCRRSKIGDEVMK